VTNAISANVPFGKIEAIKQVPGVKDVILETRYEPAVASKEADNPNMSVASEMTGGALAWAAGYTGAGSKVAIVDTGLDLEHELFQPDALEYALEQDGLDVTLMTASDTAAVWDQLHASEFISDAAGTYQNAKVPFAVNYVDGDLDVTHANDTQEEHGSHVAGIAAANRYVAAEGGFTPSLTGVNTQGEAPDAQILVMKVFGKGGGAYDSDYMAAIEDAIVLGADSVNLSLGSAAAGYVTSSSYQEIMNNLVNSDTVVVMSAGNSYGWSYATDMGTALGSVPSVYSDGVNFDTVGSPGSFTNTLAVASVNNDGFTGAYLTADEENIFYTETQGYGNAKMTTVAGKYTYVLLDGPGVDDNDHVGKEGDDFLTLGSDVVSGKIAICSRGTSSFFAKANAAAAQGAVAVIIANNTSGTISMNLTDYAYSAPAVSITQADGAFLKEIATEKEANGVTYYEGTITVGAGIGTVAYDSEYYTMSDFSSWGVPGDLSLKPEITAPGGDIYSANGYHGSVDGGYAGGHNAYENMSGTSMAAPQITGLAAVLAQYIKENDLTAKTGQTKRTLINSLLMSTAEPLIEEDSGSYYSVLKQGAGLVDANAAVNANTYVLMDEDATASYADGKVKVELGDDPDRKGSYSFGFTLNNMTDEDAFYDLSADFFTQDVFPYFVIDNSNPYGVAFDDSGNPIVSTYLDTWTVPLDATVTWTVDDEPYVPDSGEELDFNGDEMFNVDDAKAILEYVVNGTELTGKDADKADMDEDGDIDTYDAYLALLGFAEASVVVPANGSTHVVIDVTLNDIADYDDAGAYVEGYVYAAEKTSNEGAEGTVHSIPVLGYYGSWTEPEMTDVADAYARLAGEEDRTPYLARLVSNAAYNEAFGVAYEGEAGIWFLGGNPVMPNETYKPERNAINGADEVAAFSYSLIRNAAGGQFTAKNADTNEVLTQFDVPVSLAAYYNVNQARWYNTSTSASLGYTPSDLEEGTALELCFKLAPEYYLNDDGAIDWDSVHENAGTYLPLVIDNTAPEIGNVIFGVNYAENAENGLTIEIKENQYIAGIFFYNEEAWNSGEEILAFGSDPDEAEGAGRTIFVKSGTEEGEIDLTAQENQHLMIEVYDYAANHTTYKLNLNTDELKNGEYSLSISEEFLQILRGNTAKLTVEATPWGASEEVTWSSEDESIATVNEKGVVTAVGEGTTVITATSVEHPDVSASCTVEVFVIHKTLTGVLQDEDGQPLLFTWNLENTTWESAGEIDRSVTAAAYDFMTDDGAYFYQQDFDGYLHKINLGTLQTEESSEGTTASGAPVEDYDFPYLFNLSNEQHWAYGVSQGYLLVSGYATGEMLENTFDNGYYLGSYLARYTGASSFVAITWAGFDEDEDGYYDMFLALDDQGFLWEFDAYLDMEIGIGFGLIGTDLDLSYPVMDETTGNSMIYDSETGDLYLAHFNGSTSEIYRLYYDVETGMFLSLKVGDVGTDVWPAALLWVEDNEAGADVGPEDNVKQVGDVLSSLPRRIIPAVAAKRVDIENLKAVEVSFAPNGSMVPAGGLNAVTVTEPAPAVEQPEGVEPTDEETTDVVTITVTADEANNNGLYSVDYDAEELELVSAESEIQYNVINTEEAGKVVIGYATLTEVAEGDEVLVVTFKQKTGKGTNITVTTEESGEEHPEDE
ncbi:MAG: S8 family serine peptidase, partial [Oscillospiraceae bacterium]|nr:S8 family serine peptidase [Oscillospiraceae bacterium]